MKTLTVTYDVTKLTREEIDGLLLEAVVQAERSEHHPDVDVVRTVEHRAGSADRSARRSARTSLSLGAQDVADLIAAVDFHAEEIPLDDVPDENELLRLYALRRRLLAAADRLGEKRGGRGEAAR